MIEKKENGLIKEYKKLIKNTLKNKGINESIKILIIERQEQTTNKDKKIKIINEILNKLYKLKFILLKGVNNNIWKF